MNECVVKNCGCQTDSTTGKSLNPVDASVIYRIENMDCPTEEMLIRNKLKHQPGVINLEFNLIQRTLAVTHNLISSVPLEAALAEIGMQAVRSTVPGTQTTVLLITNMCCPTEENLIRNKLSGMPGIEGLDFNMVQRLLTLQHAPEVLPTTSAGRGVTRNKFSSSQTDQLVAHGHFRHVGDFRRGGTLVEWRLPLDGCCVSATGDS